MDWDEVRQNPKKGATLGEDLTTLSIADLRQRIAACTAEVGRLEAEIAKREAHEAAASRLFKK